MIEPDLGPPTIELLDASVVIRYLTNDVPELAARAVAVIEAELPLALSIVTIQEIGYTLMRQYGIPRPNAIDSIIKLLERQNIHCKEIPTELTIQALQMCIPSARVSIADSLLWAAARDTMPARVWTFDKRFPRDGIEVQEP